MMAPGTARRTLLARDVELLGKLVREAGITA
jgi:hypothetical protein